MVPSLLMIYLSLYTTLWSSKRITQHHLAPLFMEFVNDSKDVSEGIECVQHVVLLQIALFKNVKMEKLLILLMAFPLDKSDSYDPFLMNYLHGHVLIQSILTTLVAASRLLLYG